MRPEKRSFRLKIPLLFAALSALLLFVLPACSRNSAADKNADTQAPSYPRIVMTFLVDDRSTLTDELPAVSEELNRITREEIGIEVELLPVTEKEIASRFPLWMSDQEKIDLVFIGNSEISRYFGRKMLHSVDEYLYGAGAKMDALTGSGHDLTEGAVNRGFTYGISNVDDSNLYGRAYVMSKDALDRAGIVIDASKVYTMEEAGEVFRILKAQNGSVYPVCSLTAEEGSVTEDYVSSSYFSSSSEMIGIDYNRATGRFFNRYASAFYRDFISTQRSWYLEGLLYPDVLLSDYSPKELARAGIVLGYASDNSPEHLSDSGFPDGAVMMNMAKTYRRTGHAGSGYWTVPLTAEDPEASLRFLNLMYGDARITNLLSYGIEGIHYTVSDRENGLIEGVRKDDGSYLYDNPYRIYGNQEQAYRRMNKEVLSAYLKWKESAEPVSDPAEALSWQPDDYAAEIKAVQEAVARYAPLLESGSADLEVYYPRFLKALTDAGINKLVSARQKAVLPEDG